MAEHVYTLTLDRTVLYEGDSIEAAETCFTVVSKVMKITKHTCFIRLENPSTGYLELQEWYSGDKLRDESWRDGVCKSHMRIDQPF